MLSRGAKRRGSNDNVVELVEVSSGLAAVDKERERSFGTLPKYAVVVDDQVVHGTDAISGRQHRPLLESRRVTMEARASITKPVLFRYNINRGKLLYK
jgi:hypothetical protein